MTPARGTTHGSGARADTGYEHLTSEASENHVAVVGKHDLDTTHPDVPAHLIEITRIDLGADPNREGIRREGQATLVYQFLAD